MKLKIETSAGGIVFRKIDNKTHWLIVKHSQYKKWTFPKGLIGDKTENEDAKVAALREVEEEGGIKAKIINDKPVIVQYNYRFKDFFIKKTVYYYLMEYVSGDVKEHDFEVSDATFVSEDEVEKMLGFRSDNEAFIKILLLQKQLF
jgi:8-oxo-dGTP pyrophosphatase MutT (NUDIX family)